MDEEVDLDLPCLLRAPDEVVLPLSECETSSAGTGESGARISTGVGAGEPGDDDSLVAVPLVLEVDDCDWDGRAVSSRTIADERWLVAASWIGDVASVVGDEASTVDIDRDDTAGGF